MPATHSLPPSPTIQQLVDIARAGARRERDLLDFATTAGEIANTIKHVGKTISDGWEWDTPDPRPTALARLRRAQAKLAALIAELDPRAA